MKMVERLTEVWNYLTKVWNYPEFKLFRLIVGRYLSLSIFVSAILKLSSAVLIYLENRFSEIWPYSLHIPQFGLTNSILSMFNPILMSDLNHNIGSFFLFVIIPMLFWYCDIKFMKTYTPCEFKFYRNEKKFARFFLIIYFYIFYIFANLHIYYLFLLFSQEQSGVNTESAALFIGFAPILYYLCIRFGTEPFVPYKIKKREVPLEAYELEPWPKKKRNWRVLLHNMGYVFLFMCAEFRYFHLIPEAILFMVLGLFLLMDHTIWVEPLSNWLKNTQDQKKKKRNRRWRAGLKLAFLK